MHTTNVVSGADPGEPQGPGPLRPPKMRPQHQNSTKFRPQNGHFRSLNNHFFPQNFSLTSLGINSTSNYLDFSRLTMLTIVLCIYVSMHQFILFSLVHISCAIYIYHVIKFIFLYVVRICGIRNNVEHLCNSNLLLYSMYICTSRNLLQCCTSNSNVVQS